MLYDTHDTVKLGTAKYVFDVLPAHGKRMIILHAVWINNALFLLAEDIKEAKVY